MIVSWNWLKEYVDLSGLKPEEVANRLMLAGLNLESIKDAGSDVCIDLEITSNRPDCLGHIGVAREIAVLFNKELKLPPALPQSPAPFLPLPRPRRLPRSLPPLHRPRYPWNQGEEQPSLDGAAAGGDWAAGD